MKRNIRIIIPVVVYLVSVLAGYGQTYFHNRSIERLINDAGSQGEPVVVIVLETQPSWILPYGQSKLRLYNIHGDSVPLAVNWDFSWAAGLYFSEDGTLYFYERSYWAFDQILFSMKLNDSELKRIWITHVWKTFDPGETIIGQGYVAKTSNFVVVFEDRIQVFNPDGDILLTHEFINPFPSVTDTSAQFHRLSFALTHDMSKLIVIAYKQRENVGKSWIYNLETGEWNSLVDPATDFFVIEPDMGGRYIACMYKAPSGMLVQAYIDLDADGKLSSPLAGSTMPDIWTNWAALVGPSGITPNVRIYDIENDWEEYTINLPGTISGTSYFVQTLAIYEPPPNGLDGMYENFE
ncbi:hypothetical protein KAU08_06985 [bacterium]|nr:hypothetical protein [bacterium]